MANTSIEACPRIDEFLPNHDFSARYEIRITAPALLVYGHQGVRAYWIRRWQTINPSVEPLRIFEEDDGRVVVEVHQVVRDMDSNLVLVYLKRAQMRE